MKDWGSRWRRFFFFFWSNFRLFPSAIYTNLLSSMDTTTATCPASLPFRIFTIWPICRLPGLLKNHHLHIEFCENFMAFGCNGNRMLKMGTQGTVDRNDRPVVFKRFDITGSGIHHRFNRQHHAGFEPRAPIRNAKVRNLRFFMQFCPNSVSDILANNRESKRLR